MNNPFDPYIWDNEYANPGEDYGFKQYCELLAIGICVILFSPIIALCFISIKVSDLFRRIRCSRRENKE
jgi:hypothetical protein